MLKKLFKPNFPVVWSSLPTYHKAALTVAWTLSAAYLATATYSVVEQARMDKLYREETARRLAAHRPDTED